MQDILKLTRIQLVLVVLFVIFKWVRPSVLASDAPVFFKTMLLSLPNFFEGAIGVLILTGIGLVLNDRLRKSNPLGPPVIYALAVIIAAVYVISQELNFHALGGANISDRNDLIYSIVGLAVGYGMVRYVQPSIRRE